MYVCMYVHHFPWQLSRFMCERGSEEPGEHQRRWYLSDPLTDVDGGGAVELDGIVALPVYFSIYPSISLSIDRSMCIPIQLQT